MIVDSLLEAAPNTRSVVLSFDEKGKTPVKKYGGKRYIRGSKYRIPYHQKVKGLYDIFVVKNVHTGKRHFRFYDWKNSFIVIDFFEWILREIYPVENVYIILDGWSAHKSQAIKAFVDLNSRLKLAYLPSCSSWMNPIERDFSRIQAEVLDNSDFATPKQSMEVVSAFIQKELCFA
jgi:transposase